MTAPDPWVAKTPRADPDVTLLPTVYADDPPGVVAFLIAYDRPWHLTADGGAWAGDDEDDDPPLVKPCTECGGSGIWSDEDKQMACPYCGATGEGDTD